MTARKHVSGDPFAVLLGDDIIVNEKPCTRQLIDVFQKYGRSTIAVEEVPQDKVSSYGIISGSPVDDHLYALDDIVEKPSVEEAPSNIGAIGRYVFTPEIFDCIEQTSKGVDGELQLTDGIRLLNDSQKVYAHQFTGQRYDSGNKVEYVKAVLDFALKDEGMRDEILGHLEKLG